MAEKYVSVSHTIPPELLEKLDQLTASIPRASRSAVVEMLIREAFVAREQVSEKGLEDEND